jgi:hypothetical protein
MIDRGRVIVVDNAPSEWVLPWEPGVLVRTGRNMGVAWSWNVGARQVVRAGADLLVVVSQAVEMLDGGWSLLDAMGQADEWGFDVVSEGWHLIGFTRRTLEAVGPFDESFYPGYLEDSDWLYRMGLLGLPSPRENGRSMPMTRVDHAEHGAGLMVLNGTVTPNWKALAARYREKWGGDQGSETYRHPWNDPGRPIWWWPGTPYPDDDPWQVRTAV